MFKSIALLVILVAVVYSDDLNLSGDFYAESAQLSWQTVKLVNLNSGDNFTNALHDVSFSVYADPLVLVSGLLGGSVQVGTILAGASGTGKFAVIALVSGRFTVSIEVSYQKDGSDDVLNYSQDFVLVVDDDDWLLKRDNIKIVPAVATPQNEGKRSTIESRQAGNNDANITPTLYTAGDGVKTWNGFYISAGNADLLNTTFNAYVIDDNTVSVFYPDDIGNNAGSIAHNTTFYTSIAFVGNTGIYYVNSSIRYRRTMMGSWKIWYNVYPLVITGDSSSYRAANYVKAQPTSNNPIFSQSNAVIGVAVGGVALVAAVAVVAAVVIIRKKQEPITV